MLNLSAGALAAFAIAFVLTLVLASWLTPARWWRQLNLRAIAIVGLGTWGIGSVLLWLAQLGSTPVMAAMPLAAASHSYRVHEALNLRSGTGTDERRIAVVPAGTLVTATGLRDGDWWQVSAQVDGKQVLGWSSSLWLRRAEESRPTP